MADISKIKPLGSNTTYDIKDASAIKQIQKGSANGTIKYSLRGTPSTYTSDISIVDLTGYAPKNSPALTGTPTAPTADNNTNTTQIATTAFVMNAFKANDAMIFKGTLGNTTNDGATVASLPATHNQGWTYKVVTAGTYAGKVCEIGDMIICVTDGTAANDNHWTVIQTNVDGIVTGPTSATDNAIALYNGTSGKIIKNSSKTLTETTVSNTSTNSTIPTSKAVWDAIAGLDGNLNSTTPGAGKTLTAFSQTDGKIFATFGNISITKSQISDFPTSMTPTSHSHGNIANGGTITSNTVALGNGDMLLFSDSSNNGKIERSSITIGTATTTYLRNDGTWGTPAGTYTLPIATYNTLGGLKPAYTSTGAATGYTAATNTSTPALQGRTTTTGRYYAIEADKNGIPFVNVPWSDTNKYHKTGSWSGLTYTASAVNSADELKFTIPSASTSAAGAVQLSSATNSTSTTLAATASAVKAAYDLAASKTSNTGTVTQITAGTGLNTSADQTDSATKGSITTTGTLYLTKSGVTAGSYGPTANVTGSNNTTINVPQITVDAYGRVTSVTNRTYTSVNTNTDTLVKQSASTTANWRKVLLHYKDDAASTTAVTDSTNQVYATVGVSVQPSTNTLRAAAYNVLDKVTLQFNTATNALDFVFA